MVGRTLSHYRILEELGSGGMGVVYKAEDTRLRRTIALKILAEDRARSERRLKAFRQEAQAIAAIKHPNIVTIFSVEEAEGFHFITMELVNGSTLDKIIPKRGFGVDEFFELSVQIAEAISGAHEHGISHRDLKPANLMLAEDGTLALGETARARDLLDEAS